MAVPDSSLLPPPPSFKQDVSPTANADFDDAARGHAWIAANPLWQPRQHDQQTLTRIAYGDVRLTSPPSTTKNATLNSTGLGCTTVRTNARCQDTVFLSGKLIHNTPAMNELSQLGIAVDTRPDGLVITGGAPHGGLLKSHGDHRIAMAAAIAANACAGESTVRGWRAVASSYPNFAADLASVTE